MKSLTQESYKIMKNDVLKIKGLKFSYGAKTVIKGLDFYLNQGEVLSLLGPSGSGKTTLLRLIAGFEKVQEGCIYYGDSFISRDHFIPPHLRKIGMVFQESALFPHLKVSDNILFSLRSWSAKERGERLDELLNFFSIESVRNSYPYQLSGGQEKRVAIARALAFFPKLLLMDEPFTHLDASLKEELILELKESFKKMETTVFFVTHDQKEAFTFSDRLGIFKDGVLHQRGTVQELYEEPRTPFVFECLGTRNALPIEICDGKMRSEVGSFRLNSLFEYYLKKLKDKKVAWLYVRPEQVVIDETSSFRALVVSCQHLGSFFQLRLKLSSGSFLRAFLKTHSYKLKVGERVGIRLEIKEPIAFENKPD